MSNPPLYSAEDPPEAPKSRTGCILLGVGGGCLLVFLMCGGLVGLGVVGAFTAIKSSEPFAESLRRAQENPSVQEQLGQPIEAGFLVSGNINLNNDDGDADLSYSISGTKGSANVNVVATKTDGQWSYQKMTATTDNETIELLDES